MTPETPRTYPDGATVRVEDFGPVERAYAEAMHEDCNDPPKGHALAEHSPWSGGDLDGTEPWPAFMERLARHGLALVPRAALAFTEEAPLDAPATFPLDLDAFAAGIDSKWHTPETRKAWIALFYRDMTVAAAYQRTSPTRCPHGRPLTPDGCRDCLLDAHALATSPTSGEAE